MLGVCLKWYGEGRNCQNCFGGRKKHLLCYGAKRKKVVAMSERNKKKNIFWVNGTKSTHLHIYTTKLYSFDTLTLSRSLSTELSSYSPLSFPHTQSTLIQKTAATTPKNDTTSQRKHVVPPTRDIIRSPAGTYKMGCT